MNSELIEKAAKAIDPSAWRGGVAHDPRWAGEAESRRITARRQAGAAFAVFEEAHAPTDDDRELIAEADALVEQWDRVGSWTADSPIGLVMRLSRALSRRPVALGSTREMRDCTICGERVTMSNATEQWEERHKHAEPEGAPTIRDHVRALTGVTDEVLDELGGFQGEPSHEVHEFCDPRLGCVMPQGEPTDAERRITRKLEAVQGIIRAARAQIDDAARELTNVLRAAGTVTEKGED